MNYLGHTKTGIISFILSMIVVILFTFITFQDIYFPISFSGEETSQISILIQKIGVEREIAMMIFISFISFILAMIAMFQKGSQKKLPKFSIVISGIFVIPNILALAIGLFKGLAI